MANFTLTTASALLLLPALPRLGLAQVPTISTFSPARNAMAVPLSSAVDLTFSQPMAAAAASEIRVFSAQSGGRKATVATGSGATLHSQPQRGFRPGEVVSVSVPATVTSASGTAGTPMVYQFMTATTPSAATFSTGTDVTVSNGNTGPALLLDADADGDLDLVVPTAIRAVSLNDGRGNFTPTATSLSYSAAYHSVTDLNNDGNLDLLLAEGQSPVVPLLNTGTGSFVPRPSLAGNSGVTSSVVAGDVDGDGDQDVLVGMAYFGTPGSGAPPFDKVTVYLNQGTGSFAAGFPVTVAYNIFAMTLADLNNDGALDLLATTGSIFNNVGNGVSVRLNDGTGHFSGGGNVPSNGPHRVADVNGDGFLDLLAVDNQNAVVRVYLNDGRGSFSVGTPMLVGFGPTTLAVADLDGDGDVDLLTGNDAGTGGYSLSIRLNNGQGVFSGGSDPSLTAAPTTLAVGDVDGDGDVDVALGSNNLGIVRMLLNSGTGAALAATPAAPATAFTLAPNPAHERTTLHLPAGAPSQPLTLLDALGREVRHYAAPTTTQPTLDLHGLPAGVYVLRYGPASQRLVLE
jgi:hypothetical protein